MNLADLEAVGKEVAGRRELLERACARRDALVLRALGAGHPPGVVAVAARCSLSRVHQIAKRDRQRMEKAGSTGTVVPLRQSSKTGS